MSKVAYRSRSRQRELEEHQVSVLTTLFPVHEVGPPSRMLEAVETVLRRPLKSKLELWLARHERGPAWLRCGWLADADGRRFCPPLSEYWLPGITALRVARSEHEADALAVLGETEALLFAPIGASLVDPSRWCGWPIRPCSVRLPNDQIVGWFEAMSFALSAREIAA